MKMLYYGAFVPGMQAVIADVVRERLDDVSVVKLLDGAIVFETECSSDRLNFFCFNNIFSVIDIFDVAPDTGAPLELHIKKVCASEKYAPGKIRGDGKNRMREGIFSESARAVISENSKRVKTFRLVCSLENKPASINETLRQDIENYIVRTSALRVDRTRPDTEFWLLYRREGFSLFMKRLTRSREKSLRPGELTSQLAWLLCRIGGLKPGDTVLDPFCGYGAIPEAALKHFPIRKFYAIDTDSRCVKITRSRPALKNERCEIHRADAVSVSGFLPHDGIDAVITDPPWGMYKGTGVPLDNFYEGMLNLFLQILKPVGRAVILTAARRELESAAAKMPELHIAQTIPILVSGKKAAVYVMEKVRL